MSQGDYIGGVNSVAVKAGARRTVSGVFLLKTDRRVDFIASMNEDICSALVYGQRGDIFLAVGGIMQLSQPIGNNAMGNGMQEFYKKLSPFVRSFVGVIVRPDCVKVEPFKDRFRISIKWENAVPLILSERWKRA